MEVQIKSSGEWLWAEYDTMRVESETDNYRLNVTGYDGNAGDAFNYEPVVAWQANGMAFSAMDRDNDLTSAHCANSWGGGWWFRHCSTSWLNGVTGGHWYTDPMTNNPRPVSASRMMLACGINLITE